MFIIVNVVFAGFFFFDFSGSCVIKISVLSVLAQRWVISIIILVVIFPYCLQGPLKKDRIKDEQKL